MGERLQIAGPGLDGLKPRRMSACEEELAEPTFAQVVINLGEAIVDQKREDGAEIKSNEVVYIPARPQLR